MQETDPSTETPNQRRNLRRILFVFFAALCLLLLALVPPLISMNRLQRRIAGSISASIGRPVRLDSVKLNLLPWPGFTLQNLVISDDPAFSNEPVIRANVVRARLRLSSLWRHQVEFSTIHFDVDEHGSEPSMNLVRNDAGKWNIESILVQASRVNAAPTSQNVPGPAPRFPLIEATSARINIKRGSEKLPFSFIDADFELSLNNPQQWHIRLEGRPVRTDTSASDTGTVRVEGTLNRAASIADVPIDLHASWQKVPLGEATRIVTGNDAGWRGDLALSSSITGTLGAILLDSRAQIADLHRDLFSPSHALGLDLRCTAKTSFLTRDLNDIKCLLPLDPATGRQVLLTGSLPDLHHPATATWNLDVSRAPAIWCLDWARLFSQRIPPALAPQGDLTGNLAYDGRGWSGAFTTSLTQNASDNTPLALDASLRLGTPAQPVQLKRSAKPDPKAPPAPEGLILLPGTLHLGKTGQATIEANFTLAGYAFNINGNAAPAKLLLFSQLMPPATDSLTALFPTPLPETPQHLDITCTRIWGQAQTCVTTAAEKPAPRRRKR